MNSCTCENWTLKDLAAALQSQHKDNKEIVIPMFQRGKRWSKDQEHTFIDSMVKGYPVGTMLFYKKVENAKETYILVDGLQRGNSIRKYIMNPTDYFSQDSLPDQVCAEIITAIGGSNDCQSSVKAIMVDFINKQNTYKIEPTEYFVLSGKIGGACGYPNDMDKVQKVMTSLQNFFKSKQETYDAISNALIPVIVYQGDESTLPEIFDRINSKGTPLNQYEVYAASWPVDEKFFVKRSDIVEAVISKYNAFVNDGYIIHGFDEMALRNSHLLNSFEFVFGLSKYLVTKYPNLAFNTNLSEDTANPLAFELVNACLNDSNKIDSLYKNILKLDVNKFLDALENVISFVDTSISPIIKFKGNKHSKTTIYHSKYQILSMISTTFKEMYAPGEYSKVLDTWADQKDTIQKNLVSYYIYDVITNFWSDGGTSKIYQVARPNRYAQDISASLWKVALDNHFASSMMRQEKEKVSSPSKEDYVIMNAIYLHTFTAMDQLSLNKFDVEHIAPKKQMLKLIQECKGSGLPISCIANLCYLPDTVNRSKHDNNFYQDVKYLKHINLKEVEEKYSFTTKDDLEWMDMNYVEGDFAMLKEAYTEFCNTRYNKIRSLFFDSLGLDLNSAVEAVSIMSGEPQDPEKCIKALEQLSNQTLTKVGKKIYESEDKNKCFVVSMSRLYPTKKAAMYWYGYLPSDEISKYKEASYVWTMADHPTIIVMPKEKMEEYKANFQVTRDQETGKVKRYHVKFFRYPDGKVTLQLPLPEMHEIDVNEFVCQE